MIKNLSLLILAMLFVLTGCKPSASKMDYLLPDWNARKVSSKKTDSLSKTKTYLPVYSQIYELSGERKVDLAATISIRNTDTNDSIYLDKIDYYNTAGKLVRKYIDAPVYIKPAETIEIIIKTSDNEGGTGANFIFEWMSANKISKPLFEAVMISTSGQQGISFTCRGVNLD